jgi:hypothetical protein
MRVDRYVKLALQARADGILSTIKMDLLLKMFCNKNTRLSALGHTATSKTFAFSGYFF